jgi:hypothetical protein
LVAGLSSTFFSDFCLRGRVPKEGFFKAAALAAATLLAAALGAAGLVNPALEAAVTVAAGLVPGGRRVDAVEGPGIFPDNSLVGEEGVLVAGVGQVVGGRTRGRVPSVGLLLPTPPVGLEPGVGLAGSGLGLDNPAPGAGRAVPDVSLGVGLAPTPAPVPVLAAPVVLAAPAPVLAAPAPALAAVPAPVILW